MKILFASTNPGKLIEVRETASRWNIEVLGPGDLKGGDRASSEPFPDVLEDGATYLDNARLKADSAYRWSGLASLGDDSGLEVAALDGRPGLHSARFAGPQASAADNRARLTAELAGNVNREALFRCVLFLRLDDKRSLSCEATVHGTIGHTEKGSGGFGYDSLITLDGCEFTLAEMKERGLAVATHRILALESLFEKLARNG